VYTPDLPNLRFVSVIPLTEAGPRWPKIPILLIAEFNCQLKFHSSSVFSC
jgi:hypothetical protein